MEAASHLHPVSHHAPHIKNYISNPDLNQKRKQTNFFKILQKKLRYFFVPNCFFLADRNYTSDDSILSSRILWVQLMILEAFEVFHADSIFFLRNFEKILSVFFFRLNTGSTRKTPDVCMIGDGLSWDSSTSHWTTLFPDVALPYPSPPHLTSLRDRVGMKWGVSQLRPVSNHVPTIKKEGHPKFYKPDPDFKPKIKTDNFFQKSSKKHWNILLAYNFL